MGQALGEMANQHDIQSTLLHVGKLHSSINYKKVRT